MILRVYSMSSDFLRSPAPVALRAYDFQRLCLLTRFSAAGFELKRDSSKHVDAANGAPPTTRRLDYASSRSPLTSLKF